MAAGDDVLLQALNGNLAVNAAVDAGKQAGDDASLLASLGITQSGNITAGGTIDAEAQGGSIDMADGAAAVAGGNIRYLAAQDADVTGLDGANVRVEAAGGNVTDAGDLAADVSAATAQLVAGGSVGGPAAAAIDTAVGTLAARASGGSVYVSEADALTIGTVAAIGVNRIGLDSSTTPQAGVELAGASASGNVKIEAGGELTVSKAVSAGDDVLLRALNGNVALNVGVTAGDDVSVLASAGITQTAEGDIAAGGTIDVAAQGGSIDMADGATAVAGGNIRYLAAQGADVTGLDGANVRVEAAGGNVTDAGDLAADVSAATAQLVAGGSVGGPAAAAIDTAVGTLAARASGGSVYVSEADALTIGTVAAIGVNRIGLDSSTTPQAGVELAGASASGNVKIEAGGEQTVSAAVTAGDDVLLRALSGNVVLKGAVTAGDDVSVLAALGITQTAAGDIAAGGTIDVEAAGGLIDLAEGAEARTTAGGNIRYAATGDVVLDGVLNAGAGDVAVTAGGGITDHGNGITVSANGFANGNDDVNIFARQVSLRATGDIGDAGAGTSGTRPFNPITVVADEVAAQGASVAVYGKADLMIGSVGDITVTRVMLNDANVDVTSAGLSGINAGCGSVNLMADQSVIDGNDTGVDIAAGALVISAGQIIGAGDAGNSIDALEISLCGSSAPADIWINNVAGGSDRTVLAFLDTAGGVDDPVASAANGSGALIFINGQYVGGDPTFVQLFAAAEAFPAETPELKSRQGVFGDPFFLHDQLDINEPVALGLIDFILAEKATITGDPEIPADAYIEILSGGLSPSSSIWFGTKTEGGKTQTGKPGTEKKEQAETAKPVPVQISALR